MWLRRSAWLCSPSRTNVDEGFADSLGEGVVGEVPSALLVAANEPVDHEGREADLRAHAGRFGHEVGRPVRPVVQHAGGGTEHGGEEGDAAGDGEGVDLWLWSGVVLFRHSRPFLNAGLVRPPATRLAGGRVVGVVVGRRAGELRFRWTLGIGPVLVAPKTMS